MYKIKDCLWYLSFLYSKHIFSINLYPKIYEMPEFNFEKDISFSKLQQDEIFDLVTFHDSYMIKNANVFDLKEIQNRMKKGQYCYIARADSQIVGIMWYAIKEVYSPDLHCTFLIGKNCMVSYNAFVRSDFRGKNILAGIRKVSFEELYQKGFYICLDWIRLDNKASLSASKKFNAYSIGKIISGFFFGYHYIKSEIDDEKYIKIKELHDRWWKLKSIINRVNLFNKQI